MVLHYSVIATIIQLTTYESFYRNQQSIACQAVSSLLPLSHAYGLIAMVHVAPYRGDRAIFLPAFMLDMLLMAIQRF